MPTTRKKQCLFIEGNEGRGEVRGTQHFPGVSIWLFLMLCHVRLFYRLSLLGHIIVRLFDFLTSSET